MLTCNLMGGLGNQLFQIFTVISYAIKRNHDFKFINVETLGEGTTTPRKTYWKSFFSKLKTCLFDEYPKEFNVIYKEDNFKYKNIPGTLFPLNSNILIFGYFQSYKYFHENFKLISLILDIYEKKTDLLEKCKKQNILGLELEMLENTVSLHFRLGDYKSITMFHPIMSFEYYKNALSYLLLKSNNIKNVLYFCEDGDLLEVNETIKQLQIIYPLLTFIRATNQLDDWEQLLLMSACKYNVIANSTFSWWGGYLNDFSDKIVCYPSNWFGPACSNNDTNDLFPPEWIQITI